MFIRTPRSVVLLTGETCLLLAAVVAGTFVRLGTLAVPALSRGGQALLALVIALTTCLLPRRRAARGA